MCHFQAQNSPICPEQFFLVETIIITFIYLLALFIGQNCKIFFTVNPELWGCIIFGPKMVHLPQTNFFWKKSLISLSSTYWPFLLCKICTFAQMRIFSENLLISLVFHSSLSTCQKLKSDIHLLMKY